MNLATAKVGGYKLVNNVVDSNAYSVTNITQIPLILLQTLV